MEKLTNERFAEIIRDKEICEFCEDCGNDEICINCEKVNPTTAAELRLFWSELSVLVKVREIVVETAADREYIDYICPKCGDIISQRRKGQKGGVYMPNYHDRCGQRLDWTRAEAEAAIGGGGDG